MRVITLLILLTLCGCSQLQRFTINDQLVLTHEQLESNDSIILTQDKFKDTLSKTTIKNLKDSHDELTKLTDIEFNYMILDTDAYSYGAIIEDDKNYIAISSDFLNELKKDYESTPISEKPKFISSKIERNTK